MSNNAAEFKQANRVALYTKAIHEHPNLQRRAKKRAQLGDDMVIVDSEIQTKHQIQIEKELTKKLQAKRVITGFHVVITRELYEELLEKEEANKINMNDIEEESGEEETEDKNIY